MEKNREQNGREDISRERKEGRVQEWMGWKAATEEERTQKGQKEEEELEEIALVFQIASILCYISSTKSYLWDL